MSPPDHDRDGLTDLADPYPAGEDRIDSDEDGTFNAFDSDPYGQLTAFQLRRIDRDGDWTPDWFDETPGLNDFGDQDGDQYPNHSDPDPMDNNDLDGDGRMNNTDYNPYDGEEW